MVSYLETLADTVRMTYKDNSSSLGVKWSQDYTQLAKSVTRNPPVLNTLDKYFTKL